MIRRAPTFPMEHRPLHDFLREGTVWHSLEFPWFLVTLHVGRKKDATFEVLMVPSLIELKQIFAQENELFKVKFIEYVTPGFMNESGHWKMERLVRISELFNAFGWSIPRCKVQGQRTYRGLSLELRDEWLTEQIVYSLG